MAVTSANYHPVASYQMFLHFPLPQTPTTSQPNQPHAPINSFEILYDISSACTIQHNHLILKTGIAVLSSTLTM